MTTYYTYNEGLKRLDTAKRILTIDGKTLVLGNAGDFAHYLSAYPFQPNDEPLPPTGKMTVQDGYELSDNVWTQKWKFEDIPTPIQQPRKFSKMYLELALFNMGLLEQIDEFIDNQTISNQLGQTMPLRRLYDKALVFSEDNQYFSEYLETIKEELQLSDQQIEAILSQCIAEE